MEQVGVAKQQMYNEGVQKIQTNIDNVAGMDVIRDVDKAYLQSKVNELSTNLRSVAAADFSNFQLVNSVSGMTNQIVKDKNVQNAVSSTMKFRKEQAAMEQANAKGEGSISNDWDFNNQASSWINSSDIKQGFNGKYTKYTNYRKNALEVIKSLTKNESITDNDLAFDSKGNIVMADDMTRTKFAGISPEQIQQALLSTLSPDDFKQMEIDGRYNYANIPPEQFVTRINSSFKDKYDAFLNQKDILINAMDSTTSLPEKQKLKEQVDALDKTLTNVKAEYNNIASTFAEGDVESAKARLSTADFMNGFSKAFSYTQTSQTKEDRPAAKIEMERQKLNQSWKQFTIESAQKERFQNQNTALEWEKIQVSKEANKIAKAGTEGYGSLGLPTDPNDKPVIDVTKFVADTNAQINNLELQEKDFYTSQGKTKAWLTTQHDVYLKSPGSLDAATRNFFQMRDGVEKDIKTKQTLVANLRKEAEKENGNVYKLIPKNETNLIYTTSSQQKYEYTPKDIVDFNDKFNNSIRKITSSGGRGAPAISYDQKVLSSLTTKEKELANIFLKNDRGQALYPAEKVMLAKAQKMNKLANIPFQQTIKKINNQVNKGLEERLMFNQPGTHAIPLATKAQITSFSSSVLAPMITIAEANNGKIAGSKVDIDALRDAAKNPKTAFISVAEGTYDSPTKYKITVMGDKGKETSFNITPEQKESVFKGKFEKTPEMQAATPYLNQINYMKKGKGPGKSTAWDGSPVTTVANAYMNQTSFPALSAYGIAANVVTMDGGQSYYINAKVYNPETKKWTENISFPKGQTVPANTLSTVINGLTDETLYQYIYNKPATVNDITRVKNAAQKPF